MAEYVRWFDQLGKADVAIAGGKGANLGEMVHAGLPVPPGFVVTANAYHAFLDQAHLREEIAREIDALNVDDRSALDAAAQRMQERITGVPVPDAVRAEVLAAYRKLAGRAKADALLVAVRSSATIEDTEAASFAGMNRSYLNVLGDEDLLRQMQAVWASLYTPRGVFYRKRLRLDREPEIAVIVQQMVEATKSGVAFSLNPATGDTSTIVIEGAFGLGELVVQGEVEPDHYEVAKADLSLQEAAIGHKTAMLTRNTQGAMVRATLWGERADARVLTDAEVRAIADLVRRDEAHYHTAQDLEWAVADGTVYLVQSRPVTTAPKSNAAKSASARQAASAPGAATLSSEPDGATAAVATGKELVRGLGASPGVATGSVRVLRSTTDEAALRAGEILVAPVTSPDWVPFMRQAAAIVTDSGGMTSHAAIVARELGLPCVVGTRRATSVLHDGMVVTVDGGAGVVLDSKSERVQTLTEPGVASPAAQSAANPTQRDGRTPAATHIVTATKLMVNLAEPERARQVAALPVDGVGLLRAEFMLLSAFKGVHPRRLIEQGRSEEFVARMAAQLQEFTRAFAPRPVIYRSTDFRTNEFRGLEGGAEFEPEEANPMIGYRGAYRYVRDPSLFNLELQVIKQVREHTPNLHLMIPFVRTGSELRACLRLVDAAGLRGDTSFQLWIMAEVPSVVSWLPEYARLGVQGVSIGSNDLTQLVLGVDRDNEALAALFDERDPAVLDAIRRIISQCRALGLKSSICGQAPSVYPEYAETLIRYGINSISVNPDVIEQTRYAIASAEQRILLDSCLGKEG